MSDIVQQIKDSIDIEEYIGKFVKLEKRGQNSFGLCPFHGEKTPSFSVNDAMQRYKCFGCGASGDIFNFVQEYQKVDFAEAIEILAQEAGIDTKDIHFKDKGSQNKKDLYELYSRATSYYHKALFSPIGEKALQYLIDRKITKESIINFKIGFAPNQKNFITKHILNKYGKEFASKCGLLKPDKIEDKFVNRVLFPIFDTRGRPIAFTARVFEQGDERPKYLNSPETDIFQKRKVLFGLYQGNKSIIDSNNAILLEGTTDVISNHQIGLKNVLAPLGTSLTSEQLLSLKKYTNVVTFAFDNDRAGQLALIRGSNLAHEAGFAVKAVKIPAGKDSDEAIRNDPKLWKEAVNKAIPVISYIIHSVGVSSLNEKKKALEIVIPMLRKINDIVLRDSYVNIISNMFSISEKTIYQLIDETQKTNTRNYIEKIIKKNEITSINELYYLALIFQNPQFQIRKYLLKDKYFEKEDYKKVYNIALEMKFAVEVISKELPSEFKHAFDEICLYTLPTDDIEILRKDVERLKYQFRIRYIKGKIEFYSKKNDEQKLNYWIDKLGNLQN